MLEMLSLHPLPPSPVLLPWKFFPHAPISKVLERFSSKSSSLKLLQELQKVFFTLHEGKFLVLFEFSS
jgi:hypothetical protein